jgi:thymidylate kinase
MSMNPTIRFVLLLTVVLGQFFTLVIYLNTLPSQNVDLNRLRNETSKEFIDKNNGGEEATRELYQELQNKNNTEILSRINNDENIKINSLKPTTEPANKADSSNTSNQIILAR